MKYKQVLIGLALGFVVGVATVNWNRYEIISHAGRIVRVDIRNGRLWFRTDAGWIERTNQPVTITFEPE